MFLAYYDLTIDRHNKAVGLNRSAFVLKVLQSPLLSEPTESLVARITIDVLHRYNAPDKMLLIVIL